jgi:Methionine biosynthesis protein MetW
VAYQRLAAHPSQPVVDARHDRSGVLDIGCGEGEYLATMLEASTAQGVGLEVNECVAVLAAERLATSHGARSQVLVGSAPADLPRAVEALGGPRTSSSWPMSSLTSNRPNVTPSFGRSHP